MDDMLLMNGIARLIDAHTFLWIIQQNRFIDWNPDIDQSVEIEQNAESYLQSKVLGTGGRRVTTSNVFNRSQEVINETKRRAKGICQLCNQTAPFIDKKGDPYLEVHHVIWLSRGGEDSTDNTVALCPNCHKRMHILDNPDDIEKLKM